MPDLKIGSTTINNVLRGNTQLSYVYKGTQLIWPSVLSLSGLTEYFKFENNFTNSGTCGGFLTDPGLPSFGTGKFGQGIILNGTNQYLYQANNPCFGGISGGAMSSFQWINVDTLPFIQVLGMFQNSNLPRQGWLTTLEPYGGGSNWRVNVYIGAGQSFSNTLSTPLSQWNLVGFTYDPSVGVKIFINGVDQTAVTGITGYSTQTQQQFRFGTTTPSPSFYFDGTLDELTIWQRALTTTEVGLLYNKTGPLIP
jgi:hypothetical protein